MKTSCPLGVVILIFLNATACNSSGTEGNSPPQPTSTANLTYTPSASPTRTQTPIPTSTPQPTETPCSPKPPSAPPTVTASHIPKYNVPPLTYDMLLNGTFNTSMSGKTTFKNGIYQDEGRWDEIFGFAFGDLSGDGVDDAAVGLGVSFTGGSMFGVSFFAVINREWCSRADEHYRDGRPYAHLQTEYSTGAARCDWRTRPLVRIHPIPHSGSNDI